MTEPISLEKYRLLVEDEFELEEILARPKHPRAQIQREQARILREIANQLDELALLEEMD